jgi:cation transport ATPase
MRERITVHEIRCERCVHRLAEYLAPLKGLHDARVEMGTHSILVDYDDELREELDAALRGADFKITGREQLDALPS